MIRIPALALIALTGAGGQVIEVNPKAIVSIRNPGGKDYYGPRIRCLINTTDGKYHAVVEDCATVREKLESQR